MALPELTLICMLKNMSYKKEPDQSSKVLFSMISDVVGLIKLLPGESAQQYSAGLMDAVRELGAQTHLQVYLVEKIFHCLWWIRRYEIQKRSLTINAMLELLTDYSTPKSQKLAITVQLDEQRWGEGDLNRIIESKGYTPESLLSSAVSLNTDQIIKIDQLIALRVKALGQLQQSYEALVNRSILQERLKLQNKLLSRDLKAIDVSDFDPQSIKLKNTAEVKGHGKSKAKKG
jgi:hypothetical protein